MPYTTLYRHRPMGTTRAWHIHTTHERLGKAQHAAARLARTYRQVRVATGTGHHRRILEDWRDGCRLILRKG